MSPDHIELLIEFMIIAGALCAIVLWVLLKTGLAARLALDLPNSRSLHSKPIPRCGGLGLLTPTLLILFSLGPPYRSLGFACLTLAAVSLADDRIGLSAASRLAAQSVVTVSLLWITCAHYPAWLLPIAFLFLLWMSNLYNFMDGANGMAGSMTATGFSFYAYAARIDAPELAVICAVIAGAAIGFLPFNMPRARLFLGDVGAIPIGFLAGCLGLYGHTAGAWPPWFPVVVFSPFIVDATATLLRRLLCGERIWQAHREHYYQRMVRMGMSHTATTGLWTCLMLLSGIVSICLLPKAPFVELAGILGWISILFTAGLVIDRRWRQVLITRS